MKRPILYCAISFCIGIALANISIPVLYPVSLCFISIIFAAALFKNNILSHIFLYLALIFFGAAYYQNYNIPSDAHISNFISEEGAKVTIKGRVADDPVTGDAFYGKKRTTFTLRAEALRLPRHSAFGGTPRNGEEDNVSDYDWQAVAGLVKTNIYSDEEIKNISFGDEVIMEGTLSKPYGLKNPGLFDYAEYLKIKNIYAVFSASGSGDKKGTGYFLRKKKLVGKSSLSPFCIQGAAYQLRNGIREAITKCIDRPYSGFLNAILIGERTELDSSITDDFVRTGTVHVIAISGLNIALVAGIFLMIFRAFGVRKKSNLILTSLAIVFYCFVAGSSPPVVRATAVFVIASFGYIINRESDILNSLSLAAFLILLANPKELFDPSFQLSFGSVISIILFAPKIEELFGKRTNYIISSAAVSIAASIGVFPIVAKYFNIVSPIAVLANLVIVPALFVLTAASFVFLSLNLIGAVFCIGWMGKILSALTWATFYINHIFAQMPFSYIRIPSPSPFFICSYYAILSYILFAKNRKYISIIALAALNMFVWTEPLNHNGRQLKITFLDVGKGDSAIVQFPVLGTMLVDGGSGGVEGLADAGKSVVAPYLWNNGIRRLDAVVVTHFHEDHLGGLFYILENFEVGSVIDNGEPSSADMALYEKYTEIVKKNRIRRIIVNDQDEITGFGVVRLFVLNPPEDRNFSDPNDNSIVIKLEYEKFGAILTGDITSNAMERIIPYDGLLRSDVMKIPHHGGSLGKESTADRFFRQVSAEASVTSSGGRYRYGSKKKRMHSRAATDYDTKVNGAVTVFTKGDGFKIEPFCPSTPR